MNQSWKTLCPVCGIDSNRHVQAETRDQAAQMPTFPTQQWRAWIEHVAIDEETREWVVNLLIDSVVTAEEADKYEDCPRQVSKELITLERNLGEYPQHLPS